MNMLLLSPLCIAVVVYIGYLNLKFFRLSIYKDLLLRRRRIAFNLNYLEVA
jgi:hypothetical protein